MGRKRLIAIDLFAGCGGLTQGLRAAGFKVLAAVEIDGLAASTYRLNHKGVRVLHSDIQDVAAKTLRAQLSLERGELDLLAACPPCQGFSTLTTRNGKKRVEDPRNDLVGDVGRFVRAFLPKAVMLENVPGLKRRAVFRKLVRDLEKAGYEVSYQVLDASHYGVPQRRKRLILVASRIGEPKFAIPVQQKVTVKEAIGELPLPKRSKDPLHGYQENRSADVKKRIRAIPIDGGSRTALTKGKLACHSKAYGFFDVYGRMRWSVVSPTITSGCINPSKGRFLHPQQNRAITLREAAILQSFPHDYQFDMSRGRYAIAEMIGNALPPEFIRRHAEVIAISLRAG